jgi:aldehyde:ferredoxin oxidoreductase
MGPNCAIGEREAIIRLNWWCDEYGLDTISAGGVVGLMMEMFERGLIKSSELDGI